MIWSAHAAQSNRPEKARPFLNFPNEAATSDLTSNYAVFPWACETLLNEILCVPTKVIAPGKKFRSLNCREFSALAMLVNALRELENAEDGITLKHVSVLKELHRLSQRQFEWQRGFVTWANYYRSAFIYSGQKTKAFFEEKYGFSMDDFSLACFALRASFMNKPGVTYTYDLSQIGISAATRDKIFGLISTSHSGAQALAKQLRSGHSNTAYKPSIFRKYPCVDFPRNGSGQIIAPLPDLVTVRATTGLFYDVIDGGGDVKNEVAGRFEVYCSEFLSEMLPNIQVVSSFKYRLKKGVIIESPDIFLADGVSDTTIIVECKARRLSYEARFSEDPVRAAAEAYGELAKGVVQVWRFASHLRLGHIPDEFNFLKKPSMAGMILTLDTWLSAASPMLQEVFDLANEKAKRFPEISARDKIPVMFSPIEEVENTLNVSNDANFIEVVLAAVDEKFRGWSLWGILGELGLKANEEKPYPFENRVAEVLPWMSRF